MGHIGENGAMGRKAETFEVQTTVPVVVDALVFAFTNAPGCQFFGVEPNGVVRGGTGLNLATYGEGLQGWGEPIAADRTRVTIIVEDNMPLQVVDWGRKKKLIQKIIDAFNYRLANVPLQPPGPPAPPRL